MSATYYYNLIMNYIEGRIATEEFGMTFQGSFLSESDFPDDVLFGILNHMFWEWEAYYPDCTLEEETPFMISEITFRQSVNESAEALRSYLISKGIDPDK